MRKRSIVVLVVMVIAVAGGVAWRAMQPALQPPAAAPPPHRLLSSGVVEAAEVHAQLLAAAQDMPEPAMSGAVAQVPGQAQVAAIAALEETPQQPLSSVAPEQEVQIGFTGNVVGETDPCG